MNRIAIWFWRTLDFGNQLSALAFDQCALWLLKFQTTWVNDVAVNWGISVEPSDSDLRDRITAAIRKRIFFYPDSHHANSWFRQKQRGKKYPLGFSPKQTFVWPPHPFLSPPPPSSHPLSLSIFFSGGRRNISVLFTATWNFSLHNFLMTRDGFCSGNDW